LPYGNGRAYGRRCSRTRHYQSEYQRQSKSETENSVARHNVAERLMFRVIDTATAATTPTCAKRLEQLAPHREPLSGNRRPGPAPHRGPRRDHAWRRAVAITATLGASVRGRTQDEIPARTGLSPPVSLPATHSPPGRVGTTPTWPSPTRPVFNTRRGSTTTGDGLRVTVTSVTPQICDYTWRNATSRNRRR